MLELCWRTQITVWRYADCWYTPVRAYRAYGQDETVDVSTTAGITVPGNARKIRRLGRPAAKHAGPR